MRSFDSFKKNLEKQLREEYDMKKKELAKEIDVMRGKLYRQQCSEKLKLNKLSKIQKNLDNKEKEQLEKVEILEKVLSHTLDNSKGSFNEKQINRVNNYEYLEDYSEYIPKKNEVTINPLSENESYEINPSSKAVNLMEVNKKFKNIKTITTDCNVSQKKDVSLIIKDEKASLKENLNNMIQSSVIKSNPLSSESDLKISVTSPFRSVINNSELKNEPQEKDDNLFSLKVQETTPLNLNEFGKFLVKHIDEEENYRLLFEKELSKIKQKIKKIFENENNTDHCLFEYIIELWEKLEISYINRYKILSELIKKYLIIIKKFIRNLFNLR